MSPVGRGSAGPLISPQLDEDHASSARWRFGEIIEFGCVAAEGDDQGRCMGFVHRPNGTAHHTEAVATEDPPRVVAQVGPGIASAYRAQSKRHRQSNSHSACRRSTGTACWSNVAGCSCRTSRFMRGCSAVPPGGESLLACHQSRAERPSLPIHLALSQGLPLPFGRE